MNYPGQTRGTGAVVEGRSNGWTERFWLWLRPNLYTEGISKATYTLSSRQQGMLAELEEVREEIRTIRAAVGDMREYLDLPAMVDMEDIDAKRSISGDPTGL